MTRLMWENIVYDTVGALADFRPLAHSTTTLSRKVCVEACQSLDATLWCFLNMVLYEVSDVDDENPYTVLVSAIPPSLCPSFMSSSRSWQAKFQKQTGCEILSEWGEDLTSRLNRAVLETMREPMTGRDKCEQFDGIKAEMLIYLDQVD